MSNTNKTALRNRNAIDLKFIKEEISTNNHSKQNCSFANQEQMISDSQGENKLKKSLKLIDVYAMATGAMFSSGLFLLPGIAASYTGESAYLAYLFAGFFILPAMLCMAELSTAMPKAGGTYFFLDRSMGPIMGTIGGLGSWVAVVFKSAFALVGMGAYLSLYLELPITITAVFLTIAFGLINLVGAKETTWVQRILVFLLVVILSGFVISGLNYLGSSELAFLKENDKPFFASGLIGFISTIGLVFVSYAGLTKVASVAEEVENPDRNIPLGMTLSLITATIIYTLGTYILVKLLEPSVLYKSLTPVADAGKVFLGWIPHDLGVGLIVIAAIAAFASTANAGIMSASRYPFAMAKDQLLPHKLSNLGKWETPGNSIVITALAMVGVLILFDVASVAKLASAFQLLLFGLVCLAVIVMREAQIDTYKPGFNVPLYPWVPIAGILISFWLIIEMGILAIGFTGMMVIGCVLWYQFYTRSKTLMRKGAIFHVHERLGRQRCQGLEQELMTIIHDRTQAQNLAYETLVSKSFMCDLTDGHYGFQDLLTKMMETGSRDFDISPDIMSAEWTQNDCNFQPLCKGLAIASKVSDQFVEPALFVFRFRKSAKNQVESQQKNHTLMFLVVPTQPVGLDLRIIGNLATIVQDELFLRRWLTTKNSQELDTILFREDHFLRAPITLLPDISHQVGKKIEDINLPETCHISKITRKNQVIIANPGVKLEPADLLEVIGEPIHLQALYKQRGTR